jgi:hypothetical protein
MCKRSWPSLPGIYLHMLQAAPAAAVPAAATACMQADGSNYGSASAMKPNNPYIQ